jgi:hypothetical protein
MNMGFLRKPGSVALVLGILLGLAAGWFYLWTWSAASLRCVECDCNYSLTAAIPVCRRPAILALLAYATSIGAIVSFMMAWFRRRRARQPAA